MQIFVAILDSWVGFTYNYTVAEYSWSIANNFVIGVYCRCLEILSQIAFSSVANYFRIYRKKQFGIESVGIYTANMCSGITEEVH